ncbi:MAG TPA: hypothetical protein PKE28_07600, partial [Bacteroidales bacterium]|nr:hypothetical protein [Bacteroidales bacterium]
HSRHRVDRLAQGAARAVNQAPGHTGLTTKFPGQPALTGRHLRQAKLTEMHGNIFLSQPALVICIF